MNVKELKEKLKYHMDNEEVVIQNKVNGQDEIKVWGLISCEKCLLMPNYNTQTFKQLIQSIKYLISKYYEDSVSEKTRDEISFWISPIGSMAKLSISLDSMCGKIVWHKTCWYNINLLFFKILGKFKLLNKRYQEYYNSLEEYKK